MAVPTVDVRMARARTVQSLPARRAIVRARINLPAAVHVLRWRNPEGKQVAFQNAAHVTRIPSMVVRHLRTRPASRVTNEALSQITLIAILCRSVRMRSSIAWTRMAMAVCLAMSSKRSWHFTTVYEHPTAHRASADIPAPAALRWLTTILVCPAAVHRGHSTIEPILMVHEGSMVAHLGLALVTARGCMASSRALRGLSTRRPIEMPDMARSTKATTRRKGTIPARRSINTIAPVPMIEAIIVTQTPSRPTQVETW